MLQLADALLGLKSLQIHGTCLGFQLLHILASNVSRNVLLVETDSTSHATTLDWAAGAKDSYLLKTLPVSSCHRILAVLKAFPWWFTAVISCGLGQGAPYLLNTDILGGCPCFEPVAIAIPQTGRLQVQHFPRKPRVWHAA